MSLDESFKKTPFEEEPCEEESFDEDQLYNQEKTPRSSPRTSSVTATITDTVVQLSLEQSTVSHLDETIQIIDASSVLYVGQQEQQSVSSKKQTDTEKMMAQIKASKKKARRKLTMKYIAHLNQSKESIILGKQLEETKEKIVEPEDK